MCQLRSGGVCRTLNVAGTSGGFRAGGRPSAPRRGSCERSGCCCEHTYATTSSARTNRARVPRDEPRDRRRDAVRASLRLRCVHSRAGGGRTTAHHQAPRLLRHAKPLASRRATHGRSSAVGVHAMADDNARAAMATGVLHPRPRRGLSGSFQVGSGRAGSSLPPALLVRRAESGSREAHHACGAMALVECMAAGPQLLQRPDSDGVASGATCGVERAVERGLVSCRH